MHVLLTCFHKSQQQFLWNSLAWSHCVCTKKRATPHKQKTSNDFSLGNALKKKHHRNEGSGIRASAFPGCWLHSFMHSKSSRRADLITSAWWQQKCAACELRRWKVEARSSVHSSRADCLLLLAPGWSPDLPNRWTWRSALLLHEIWHFYFEYLCASVYPFQKYCGVHLFVYLHVTLSSERITREHVKTRYVEHNYTEMKSTREEKKKEHIPKNK